MTTPASPPPEPVPGIARQQLAVGIIAGATVLGLLYVGREVLVPITLALILSMAVAPLVRTLQHIGLSRVPAVLAAASTLAVFLLGLTAMIGLQMVHIAASLPQYESTIEAKVEVLRELTVGRIESFQGEARRVTNRLGHRRGNGTPALGSELDGSTDPAADEPVPVVIRAPTDNAFDLARRVLASAWVPVQTAGIVLVVLLFVLLEHDTLRDRFIRVAGGPDLRATTAAIDDAGARLSRFFVSQFSVNFAAAAAIWLGLFAIGYPHAGLWAALMAVLRFVPYVGVVAAALSAALLAAAVEPGWSLMIMTLCLFASVEIIVSQWVEPQLFGHTTGLSPLAIVLAAIFWSWLWGPVGLVLSTPVTLCLVVAGRHVAALGFLDVLLGDAPALTMPQRFYQRALSGDSDEIITAARAYLKRKSFAAYCDSVLLRALLLARIDLAAGSITAEQRTRVREVIVRVVEALGNEPSGKPRRRVRHTVLDDADPGRQLRLHREAVEGPWQGPLAAPANSVALCFRLLTAEDELMAEIFVRVLRDLHIDARHFAVEELPPEPPPGANPESLGLVCLVNFADGQMVADRATAEAELRRRFPGVCLMAVALSASFGSTERAAVETSADVVARSFEEAAQHAIARFRKRSPGTPAKVSKRSVWKQP